MRNASHPFGFGITRDLALSLYSIAPTLQVDRPTVERWRANCSMPQVRTRDRLAALRSLRDQLLRMVGTPELARVCLREGSRYLGGFTPQEALKGGRVDWVRADLDGLTAGVYL